MYPRLSKYYLCLILMVSADALSSESANPIPDLEIRLGTAPSVVLRRTHFLEIGQIANGTSEMLELSLANNSKQPLPIAVFASTPSVLVSWDRVEARTPKNLIQLRHRSSAVLRVTFLARTGDDVLPEIVLTTPRGILTRIIVHAIVRSVEYLSWSQSQSLASREGDAWGDYYPICSGPPPFGYAIDWSGTTFRVHENVQGYGARNCDKGAVLEANNNWTRCTTPKHDESGVCYAVSIQGYKADVSRVQNASEYLTVRWRLSKQPPELR